MTLPLLQNAIVCRQITQSRMCVQVLNIIQFVHSVAANINLSFVRFYFKYRATGVIVQIWMEHCMLAIKCCYSSVGFCGSVITFVLHLYVCSHKIQNLKYLTIVE